MSIPKCIEAVRAVSASHAESIILGDEERRCYVIIDLETVIRCPEAFLWRDDPEVTNCTIETFVGSNPYQFLILFFEREAVEEVATESTVGNGELSEDDEELDCTLPGGFLDRQR